MADLQRKEIRNLGARGLIRPAAVDHALIPDGAVAEVKNFHFDRIGVSTLRPGLTRVGASVTTTDVYSCVGLHNAQAGTIIAVFTGGGSSQIFTFTSGSWASSLTGGTAGVNIRFVDFGSFTIVANFFYNTLSSMLFWAAGHNGTSYWRDSGDPINPQNMWGYNPQLLEAYKSRVYAAGDTSLNAGSSNFNSNPSRLFFSAVISSSGRITWAPTTDYVDINPGDGEGITGLKRFSLELLVFKPNYTYRFRTSGVDPDPLIKVGTRSNESIVEGQRGLYFHHDTGFYRYSGGYPEKISLPIIDFVEAIPFSQYSSVAGWRDSNHIYWSVGNITIAEPEGNVVWKNVVLRYTESSSIWTVYSYPGEIRRGSPFFTGTSSSVVVGTANGVVAEFNKGNTDLGEPIKYSLVTKWYEDEGIENRKTLQEIVSLFEKSLSPHLMYQTDDQDWKEIQPPAVKYLNYHKNLGIKYHRIRYKITGVSTGEPMVFRGIVLIKGTNDGIIQ